MNCKQTYKYGYGMYQDVLLIFSYRIKNNNVHMAYLQLQKILYLSVCRRTIFGIGLGLSLWLGCSSQLYPVVKIKHMPR